MGYPNVTSINASKGLGEIFNYINLVTDEWFSRMLLIGIYVIILIGYYKSREDFSGGLAVAGFGTFVISLLFWMGGMVSGFTLGWVIGIAIVGVIIMWTDNKASA